MAVEKREKKEKKEKSVKTPPQTETESISQPTVGFDQLGLSEAILHAIKDIGYESPTPIQAQAIPVFLTGRDLIGQAQTGTGKTAAFGLPILSMLKKKGKLRCLILEPTRELAAQVETAFRDFSRFSDLETGVMFGGVGYGPQRECLKKGIDVLVATPGRLIDFIEQKAVDLRDINFLVLDEMDRKSVV